MKISGFNGGGNWGRRGNDNEDEKNKGKVDDKRKVTSQDDQEGDKDKDKKDTKKDTGRRGRNHFDGLGQRMRDGFSDLSSRISARIGSGHGDHIRGRLQDVSQRAVGLGKNASFFTGLSLIRFTDWMRNAAHSLGSRVSNAVHNIHTRRGDGGSGGSSDPKSRISGPVDGTFVHTAGPDGPGGSGPDGPGGGIDPNTVNPIPKPPRTFEYKGNGGNEKPIPAPRIKTGSNSSTDGGGGPNAPKGILKQPGSSSSDKHVHFDESRNTTHDVDPHGAEHRIGMDQDDFDQLEEGSSYVMQQVVTSDQINMQDLKGISEDVVAGIEASGGDINGSPYMTHVEPGDGSIGNIYNILGSNLTVHAEISFPAERTYRFFGELRAWGEDTNSLPPEDVNNLPLGQMSELQQRIPDFLELIPQVTAMGGVRSELSVTMDPALGISPGGGDFVRITGSEPLRVNLGSTIPSSNELDVHHGQDMSPVRRFLASFSGRFGGSRDVISIFRSGGGFPGNRVRRFLGGPNPNQEITNRIRHLTQQQRNDLSRQADNLTDMLRLLPLGGPGLRADIYIPDEGNLNTMPRIVLGGFDHVSFGTEVGNGVLGIRQTVFEEARSENLSGAFHLRNILGINHGNRIG